MIQAEYATGNSQIFIYHTETGPNPGHLEHLGEGGNAHIDGGGNFIVAEHNGEIILWHRDGDQLLTIEPDSGEPGVWSPEIDASGRYITFWTAAGEIEIDGQDFYLQGGGGGYQAQVIFTTG